MSTDREPDWPSLADSDQQVVDAWWKDVRPVYTSRGGLQECGWLLERVHAFLDHQPRLFRYLYLHEEFLFDLSGALVRAGRMGDYLVLLRRLRGEQPEMYHRCFGYYDRDLLTEALRTGRRAEIPECLRLFKEHPVEHIDQFASTVDLLAWRGCQEELRELLESTAETIADSPQVINGDFGLMWLTDLAMFPFLEAGDDSHAMVDKLFDAATAPGYLSADSVQNRDGLARTVVLASRSVDDASLNLKDTSNELLHDHAGWSYTGWVRRTKGLTWCSARFLANALLDYWAWREDGKKPNSPFGMNHARLNHYLARCCRNIIGLHGVRALSTLQAFHYLTEYLAAHDYFSTAEAARLQAASAGFYETLRGAVDSCDPGYRICPTYQALITAPVLPSRGELA